MNQRSGAFSLVEVTIALGIAAFSLIAVFGLLAVGTNTNRDTVAESTAANILSAVAADLRATPTTSAASPQFSINFGALTIVYFDASGNVTATPSNGVYRVTITFPATSGYATYARLKISWPAAVDPSKTRPSGFVETFAAFDRR
jgi:uncharacterized protein (TIGR02598 family)